MKSADNSFDKHRASLIETCKLNAVDPYAYLRATLIAIANKHPKSHIDDLMPWEFQKTSS